MALGLIVLILLSLHGVAFKAEAANPLATSVSSMISVVAGTDGGLYWNGFFTTTGVAGSHCQARVHRHLDSVNQDMAA